jgi:hypothetical protein
VEQASFEFVRVIGNMPGRLGFFYSHLIGVLPMGNRAAQDLVSAVQ